MYGKYGSPFGVITFEICNNKLVHMTFDDLDVTETSSDEIKKVKDELDAYFNHKKTSFKIDLAFIKGTPFQKAVWERLVAIPYGVTKSYQEIANEIDHPKAFRAVGQACKKNPIGLIVPCHRVIGKDGSMTGYSGKAFIDLKQKLITFEKEITL